MMAKSPFQFERTRVGSFVNGHYWLWEVTFRGKHIGWLRYYQAVDPWVAVEWWNGESRYPKHIAGFRSRDAASYHLAKTQGVI